MENVLTLEHIVKKKTYPVLAPQNIRKLRTECLIRKLSVSLVALVQNLLIWNLMFSTLQDTIGIQKMVTKPALWTSETGKCIIRKWVNFISCFFLCVLILCVLYVIIILQGGKGLCQRNQEKWRKSSLLMAGCSCRRLVPIGTTYIHQNPVRLQSLFIAMTYRREPKTPF